MSHQNSIYKCLSPSFDDQIYCFIAQGLVRVELNKMRYDFSSLPAFREVHNSLVGWCEANAGSEGIDWVQHGVCNWFFRDKNVAVMFKLVCG